VIFNVFSTGGAYARTNGVAAGEANKTWVMFSMESGNYYPIVRGGLLAVLRACYVREQGGTDAWWRECGVRPLVSVQDQPSVSARPQFT
jgi:hypothetical protein